MARNSAMWIVLLFAPLAFGQSTPGAKEILDRVADTYSHLTSYSFKLYEYQHSHSDVVEFAAAPGGRFALKGATGMTCVTDGKTTWSYLRYQDHYVEALANPIDLEGPDLDPPLSGSARAAFPCERAIAEARDTLVLHWADAIEFDQAGRITRQASMKLGK